MSIKIYHNPRCTKSRATLQILSDKGLEPEIVLYLEDAPSVAVLKEIAKALNKQPSQFIRSGESVFKELGLASASDAQLFEAMSANPILIERPIVVNGNKAAIGRPPEDVLDIL